MLTPRLYVSQTLDELKKVVWPTRMDIIRLTTVVLLISLFVGIYIGGLDFLFAKGFETLVNIVNK